MGHSAVGWAKALSAQHFRKIKGLIHLFWPHQNIPISVHIPSRNFAMIGFISLNVGLMKR
jgi:hypothetical protein